MRKRAATDIISIEREGERGGVRELQPFPFPIVDLKKTKEKMMKQSKEKNRRKQRGCYIFLFDNFNIGSTDKNRRVYNRIISKKGN